MPFIVIESTVIRKSSIFPQKKSIQSSHYVKCTDAPSVKDKIISDISEEGDMLLLGNQDILSLVSLAVQSGKRILILDNDKIVLDFIVQMLAKCKECMNEYDKKRITFKQFKESIYQFYKQRLGISLPSSYESILLWAKDREKIKSHLFYNENNLKTFVDFAKKTPLYIYTVHMDLTKAWACRELNKYIGKLQLNIQQVLVSNIFDFQIKHIVADNLPLFLPKEATLYIIIHDNASPNAPDSSKYTSYNFMLFRCMYYQCEVSQIGVYIHEWLPLFFAQEMYNLSKSDCNFSLDKALEYMWFLGKEQKKMVKNYYLELKQGKIIANPLKIYSCKPGDEVQDTSFLDTDKKLDTNKNLENYIASPNSYTSSPSSPLLMKTTANENQKKADEKKVNEVDKKCTCCVIL